VERLGAAHIGVSFNQYAFAEVLRNRLSDYLARRLGAQLLLVGEAAGYRGARVSGLPFTSERQLTGTGPAEATATIVHRVLAELGVEDDVLLWNVVPTHPHRPGEPDSNRRPRADEIEASRPFLEQLAAGRRVVPVGRVAEVAIGMAGLRHPSHGGASEFRAGLAALV
jgi:Uracil DNA glycosylase superfamily